MGVFPSHWQLYKLSGSAKKVARLSVTIFLLGFVLAQGALVINVLQEEPLLRLPYFLINLHDFRGEPIESVSMLFELGEEDSIPLFDVGVLIIEHFELLLDVKKENGIDFLLLCFP
jgi:hypothetical protein